MSSPPLVIVDPHFHMWTAARPNANLGDILAKVPLYDAAAYGREASAAGLSLHGAVHVETIVGQCAAGPALDAVDETRWVCAQIAAGGAGVPPPRRCALVAFASLAAPAAALAAQLDAHAAAAAAAGVRLAGVRMIVNFDAADASLCWPQVEHGGFVAPAPGVGDAPAAAWRAGLASLAARGLSFDLQCNPPQLAPAAAAFAATPGLRVVVNHLGCPRLGRGADADAAVLAHWRAGMAALAANPHVCVKASMLSFIREGWTAPGSAARAEVAALVHEVVALFGARRVMFASNFPVDKVTTGALADVYAAFRDIAQRYSDEERRDLFANTAARAYGLPEVE
jgi:predicted TIM-barrel fold metal-dependent hydrolase